MAAVSSGRLAPILFSLLCLPSVISSVSLSSGFSQSSFDFNFSLPGSFSNHPDLNFVYLNSTHPQSQDGRANASSVHPKVESEVIRSNSSMEMISKAGIGRVSYARPVLLWDEATGEVANFSMSMTFCLHHHQGSRSKNSTDATRMAMFLGPYQPTLLPPPMMSSSMMNHSSANATRTKDQTQTMEVEFDAYLQPEKLDNSGCRRRTVSIDVNYIVSVVQVNTTVLIPSDAMMNQSSTACTMMIVQMDYDGGRKRLDSSIRIGDVSHHINASVDLSKIMPKEAGIGFRSTTGQPIELHNVLRWSFNSTLGHTDSTVTVTPPQTESQHQNYSQHFWKQFLVRLDPWNGNAELNLQLQFQRIWERINLVISTNFNVTLAYVW